MKLFFQIKAKLASKACTLRTFWKRVVFSSTSFFFLESATQIVCRKGESFRWMCSSFFSFYMNFDSIYFLSISELKFCGCNKLYLFFETNVIFREKFGREKNNLVLAKKSNQNSLFSFWKCFFEKQFWCHQTGKMA